MSAVKILTALAMVIATVTSAWANQLHSGDVLEFPNEIKGCKDPYDIHSYDEASCQRLPKIKWKIVNQTWNDGIESAYCIIAADPMNVSPPKEDTMATKALRKAFEEKAERELCLWVKLRNEY
jgi:hypothetical protein